MTKLDELGRRYKKLVAELEALKPQLHDEIRRERAAGVSQRELMERSGYKTIQQIRTITQEAGRSKETA